MAAETFGLAAGVAGFVGLTGQMAEGWLFLKNFAHNVKHAPEEIRSLSVEIQDIDKTAKKIGEAIQAYCEVGISIDDVDYKPALNRCFETVEAVGKQIAKDVARFNDGKGSWWQRMKAAARKTLVSEGMKKLEQAKTHLIMVQGNLSHATQLVDHSLLVNTQASILSSHHMLTEMDMTINHVHGQGQRLEMALTEAVKLLKSFSEVSSSPHIEASELPTAILKATPSVNVSSDAHCFSESMLHGRQRGRRLQSTTYRFPLFQITVVRSRNLTDTTESSDDDRSSIEDRVSGRAASSFSTVAYLNFRLWPFRKGIFMSFSPSFSPGVDMRLRTRHFVSWDSPITQACRKFDLDTVKRLFNDRLASPYDVTLDVGWTLVSVILNNILVHIIAGRHKKVTDGVELLMYLVQCAGFEGVEANFAWLSSLQEISPVVEILDTTPKQHLSDMTRMLLSTSTDDPFSDSIRLDFTIRERLSLILQPALAEHFWDPDWQNLGDPDAVLKENDYDILKDPSGQRLIREMLAGRRYKVVFTHPYRSAYQINSPLHALLLIAATTDNEKVVEGCWNRCKILLEHKYDPEFAISTGPDVNDVITGATSAYGYATHFGLADRIEDVLKEAGATNLDIIHLQDEEAFAGVPELLDGQITYMTRMECRREFLDKLCTNGLDLEEASNREQTSEVDIGNSIGSYDYESLWRTINRAAEAWPHKDVPGAWLDDGEYRLTPGKSFDWYLNWDPDNCLNYNTGLAREDGETFIRYNCVYWDLHSMGRWPINQATL